MMQHHLSFQVKLEDLLAAPQRLRCAGISPKGRRTPSYPRGEPTDEPIVFAWMPAASIFFDDPDGNLLEYIAMLADLPRPELGIVRWSEWNAGHTTRIAGSGTNIMTPVEQLFEDHISVRDLERSIGFYRDMLGMVPLLVGFQVQKRATFFRGNDVDSILRQPITGACRKSMYCVLSAMGLLKTTMMLRLSNHSYLHRI